MANKQEFSRRIFLAATGSIAATSWMGAEDDKSNLPVIAKRVEKVFKAPCSQPNALQFVDDGLWILDQVDPNKAYKVRIEDGSVIHEIQTESIHGSGITYGNEALWIGSTKTADGTPPKTLLRPPGPLGTLPHREPHWVRPSRTTTHTP